MESYDEDLNENSFFQTLQTEHSDLFHKATAEGWIICIPCEGSIPKYALTHEDFFSHILIPSDELPESHYRTLNDKEVRICNRVITIEHNDVSRPYSTHILFEETFYSEEFLKYKVLCVESPLEQSPNLGLGSVQGDHSGVISIQTLRDCIDLLWTESRGKHVLEKIDDIIQLFLTSKTSIELEPLMVQRDAVSKLYVMCLQTILQDGRVRDRTSTNRHLLENIKLSVETYMLHAIYKKIIKGITACTAYDDSHLNKIIRNLSDIQLRDLGVRSDLYDTVSRAKQELSRVDGYSTVLGKIGCLKRMVAAISKQNVSNNLSEFVVGNVVAADDLLPIIVFLVIKTGLPNWIAHLTFMKLFHFSNSTNCQVDEYSFLITTLEAAIEHINSGILLGSADPEAQMVYENKNVSEVAEDSDNGASVEELCGIGYFFDQIRLGKVEPVEAILEKNFTNISVEGVQVLGCTTSNLSTNLCHPLCSCDKCEHLLSKILCDTTPTIHSCDDRGFTALHVSCLFGLPTMVDLLIKYGSIVDATDYSGSTPLHYAAAKGHQNALLLLLHSGAKIDIVDNEGNIGLHLASNNGHEGCVKALIYFAEHMDIKLNINSANNQGNTPLHNASRWGYEGIVQILLDYGGSAVVENKLHMTPLDYAHSLHISRLLLQSMDSTPKTNPFPCKNSNSFSAILKEKEIAVAASSKEPLDFVDGSESRNFAKCKEHSEVHGVRPETTEEMKQVEKLLRAVAHGDTLLASYYLGVDKREVIEHENQSLCHPLCTCEKCQPEISSDESNGSRDEPRPVLNINVCNAEGFTALHVAAMHGRADLIQILLDAGANINLQTKTKKTTALHIACQNQRLSVVQLLLQHEANPNVQDSRGNTALHYACFTGNTRIVDLIMKDGSNVRLDLKNESGKTALQEAEEKMSLGLIRLLRGEKRLSLSSALTPSSIFYE